MTKSKCYENVRSSPLAVELDDEQCEILAGLVEVRSLKDGEMLIREGEIGDELHIVVAGHVAVTRESGDGDWITLHTLRPRDFAGELGFLDDREHSASLRALGPVEIFSLKRERLERLIDSQPKLVYYVMRAIVREIHGILRRMNTQHVELSNYISKQHGRY
jgi:CRP-like cAMP-binding protein